MTTVFSPGEVIFFGEHSVVYGRNALAAAISRGITVSGEADSEKVEIRSSLGGLKAEISGLELKNISADELLLPLAPLFERCFKLAGRATGAKLTIESTIPEQSGLASSAAVSSALIHFLLQLLRYPVDAQKAVALVYESEIDIQKRGSIIGSACTVNGGFVEVSEKQWKKISLKPKDLKIAVIDVRERCATSVSTQIVKDHLNADEKAVNKMFDEMDAIARDGKASLERGDFGKAGKLMTQNQTFLKKLGVSTPKIDRLLESLKPHIFGGKITGAGGGGCIVCLPKEGSEKKIARIAEEIDCDLLEAEIRYEGAGLLRGELCKP